MSWMSAEAAFLPERDRLDAGDAGASVSPGVSILPEAQVDRCLRHVLLADIKSVGGAKGLWAKAARTLFPPDLPSWKTDAPEIAIDEDGVGLDSLARLSAATAVSRFFDLGSVGLDDYLVLEPSLQGWCRLAARRLTPGGPEAVFNFQTSGSIDAPRVVAKRLPEMLDEVDALISAGVAKGARRAVSLVAPHHAYGFIFSVLLPGRAGLSVFDAALRSPGATLEHLEDGDLLIGTPFHWELLLAEHRSFPAGVRGVTSGASMPPELWQRCLSAGLSGLIEVFGATETGGIGLRHVNDAPFDFLSHIEPGGGRPVYRRNGRPVPLQDLIVTCGDAAFRSGGRLDRAVQVAGVNVSLSRVCDVLRRSDYVSDAAVRPSGPRLKAFIVPTNPEVPHDVLHAALFDHVARALEPAARPTEFAIGTLLPVNEMGKLADW